MAELAWAGLRGARPAGTAPQPGEELLADLRVVQQLEVAGAPTWRWRVVTPGSGSSTSATGGGTAVRHEQVAERPGEARAAGHRGGDEAVLGAGQQRQEVAVVVDAVDVTAGPVLLDDVAVTEVLDPGAATPTQIGQWPRLPADPGR